MHFFLLPFAATALFAISPLGKQERQQKQQQRVINNNSNNNNLVSSRLSSTGIHTTTTLRDVISSVTSSYIEKSKYEALLDWLKKDGNGGIVNDCVYFSPSNVGGGYGAFVSQDVPKDELLFTVPRSACVTLKDATDDPKCGPAFSRILEKAGSRGGNTVIMAAYLAKEYLISIIDDDDITGSTTATATKFGPYLETLPWERGINNQEHVLFWNEDNVDSTLKGSFCYREVNELRSEVALASKVIEGIVGDTIRIARGEMEENEKTGIRWPWQITPDRPKEPVYGLDLAVRGAFVSLLTRSFQDDTQEEKLVPMLDMLQHNEDANIRHSTLEDTGTVEVRARRTIQAGEELYNQYVSEDDDNMPYHRFFTRFGFVPGIIDTEDPITELLKDKSSIFYPKIVEI